MKQAAHSRGAVREGNAEEVPCCIFYELFYYVPEKKRWRKNKTKNRLAAPPFYKLIYEVAETLLLLSRG